MTIKDVAPILELNPEYNSLSENTDGGRASNHYAFVRNVLLATDFGLICTSALAAWYYKFVYHVPAASVWSLKSHERFEHDMAFIFLYAILFVLYACTQNLYINPLNSPRERAVPDVLKSAGLAALIVMSLIYLSGNKVISREFIGMTIVLSGATLVISRLSFHGRDFGVRRNVVVVGAGRVGKALSRYLSANPRLGYVFIGFIDRRFADRYSTPPDVDANKQTVGSIADLELICKSYFIDEILVTLPCDRNLVKDVAVQAKEAGIDLRVVPDLYDGLAYGASIEFLGQFPLLTVHQQPIPALELFIKRLFDI